jgi:Ca-activated chloride channel family protein
MFKKAFAAVIAAVTLMSLAGCTNETSGIVPYPSYDEDKTLHVLAGSEVKDMAPILVDMEKKTGVHLEFTYMGTLEGTEEIASGRADGKYQATWFPSNRYLALLDGGSEKVDKETKIMSSPVVLGVKKDKAAELGWNTKTPTWQDIVSAVESGKLHYGMTSPVSSNSGFSALIEATTALSDTGDAITTNTVSNVSQKLKKFFEGQNLTSGSSGWLAEKFSANSAGTDAIFNYESILKGLKVDNEPLTIITPSDGVITADYPLTLLNDVSSTKEKLYNKAVKYLTTSAVQKKITSTTLRNTGMTSNGSAFELPFPNKLDAVRELISTYLSEIKKPSNIVFTVDTSGSMDGQRINDLRGALKTMTNNSDKNSFVTFQNRETVEYVEFANDIKSKKTFQFTKENLESQLSSATSYIDSLNADGGTAMYNALEASYKDALQFKKDNPDNFVSVVLFSDGETNQGKNYQQFVDWYNKSKASDSGIQTIPAFVVQFGEANKTEMEGVADLTQGKIFDANETGLVAAFKEIRGYQ